MTQWQGGLLLSQLRRFEEHAALREANGNYLADRTAEIGGFEPQARDPRITRHGYHLFISRYDPDRFHGLKRETFRSMNAPAPARESGSLRICCWAPARIWTISLTRF